MDLLYSELDATKLTHDNIDEGKTIIMQRPNNGVHAIEKPMVSCMIPHRSQSTTWYMSVKRCLIYAGTT